MDSNLPAHYWREMLGKRQLDLHKFVRKAAWTHEDEEKVDLLSKAIKHHTNMLEWCDLRDNDYWTWDQWLTYQHDKNKHKVNAILGTLPADEF